MKPPRFRYVVPSSSTTRASCCAAMRHVAHLAIRNRGTLGGNLAHADPAAELPMLMCLLDATIVVRSGSGERTVPAGDFFVAPRLVSAARTARTQAEPPTGERTGWTTDFRPGIRSSIAADFAEEHTKKG